MKIIDIYDNGGYDSAPDIMIADRLRLISMGGITVGAVRRKGSTADILAGTSGISVATTGFGFGTRFSLPYKLRRLTGDSDTVVIHTYSMDMAEMALLISRAQRGRRMKTVLELTSGIHAADTSSVRFTLDGVDGLIFHTSADRDMFLSEMSPEYQKQKKVAVIAPGITITEKAVEAEEHDGLTLIWGGRLTADCGMKNVIEAIGMLPQIPVKLIVAGQGKPQGAVPVIKRVKALGLADRVDFLGDVALTPDRLMKADALIIPAPHADDAMANGVMAMASGLPLILADEKRMHQLGQDDVNALFYDPADKESLSAIILRMAEDRRLRTEMGKAAGAKAEAQYDLRFHIDNLLAFYTSLFV